MNFVVPIEPDKKLVEVDVNTRRDTKKKRGENSVRGVGVGAKEQTDGEHKFSFNQKRKILFLTKSKFGIYFRRGERDC